MSNLQQFTDIFSVYSNVHKMLIDRQFCDIVSGEYSESISDFLRVYVKSGTLDKEAMNFVRMNTTKKKDPSFISVYFTTNESIGINYIVKLSDKMASSKISHCILIYPKNVTSSAKKFIEKSSKFKIEAFSEEELVTNITKHKLMPLHQVLTEEEKERFLSQSRFVDNQLPRIQFQDPVAKYYGMKRGDVVRIIRKSDTAGLTAYFRICL